MKIFHVRLRAYNLTTAEAWGSRLYAADWGDWGALPQTVFLNDDDFALLTDFESKY